VLLYLTKRVLAMIPLLIGITLISFITMHLAPGSPTDLATNLNPDISEMAMERLTKLYGLDKPLHVQYWNWFTRLLVLDFGNSFSPDARPVIEKIAERLPVTISINVISLVLVFIMSVPIGVYSATNRGSFFDKASTVFVFVGFAAPGFWVALLCMIFFGVYLDWLPISGLTSLGHEALSFWGKIWDYAEHLAMPVLISSVLGLAGMSRYTRASMLEVIRQDYITTARAKGLRESAVIYSHAMRNALMPIITILGLSLPSMIGGAVIYETIFAIPGMGKLGFEALMGRDYPVIMGVLVISSVLTLVGNLLADVAYAVADPRVRRR
jgi:peptide/nickel transport system permease protein